MLVDGLTSGFPKHETYGLSSQMRRAAVSTASHLAEGSARRTKRDLRQFVTIARGSNFKLQTQLISAAPLSYAPEPKLREAEMLALDVGRMLHGLSQSLRPSPAPHSPIPDNT